MGTQSLSLGWSGLQRARPGLRTLRRCRCVADALPPSRGFSADTGATAHSQAEYNAALAAAEAAEREWEEAQAKADSLRADFDRDADRIDSAKAGVAAALGGSIATVPLLLSLRGDVDAQFLLEAGSTAASCLLFGITFRYAIREDAGNGQLKSGVVGAFGLTRGLAIAQEQLLDSANNPAQTALLVGESLLSFFFAAAAVEWAMRAGLILPKRGLSS